MPAFCLNVLPLNSSYRRRSVGRTGHVDHFLPWARYPDDGIHTTAVADEWCNGSKRDFLAGPDHLERWRERNTAHAAALARAAVETKWESRPDETVGVARAIYLRLSASAQLWDRAGEFVLAVPGRCRQILA